MKKILIIGSSGAGKSTFTRRLGALTNIEIIHLDKIHWLPNWTEPGKAEWKKTVEKVIKGDSWILDGNYSGTMEMRIRASDTVIFLDLPRMLCIYRILKRVLTYRKSTRPDMATGCDEKFDWKFLIWVWGYPNRTKPKVEELLDHFQAEKTIIRLKSRKEVENFFMNYPANTVKSS